MVLRVDRSLEARAERSRGSSGASSASGEAGAAVASPDQPSARAADHTTNTNVSMVPYNAIRTRHRLDLPKRTPTLNIATITLSSLYHVTVSTDGALSPAFVGMPQALHARTLRGSPATATAATLSSTPPPARRSRHALSTMHLCYRHYR